MLRRFFIRRRSLPSPCFVRLPCANREAAGCFTVFIRSRSLPSLYSVRLPCASREAAGCFTIFLLAVALCPAFTPVSYTHLPFLPFFQRFFVLQFLPFPLFTFLLLSVIMYKSIQDMRP